MELVSRIVKVVYTALIAVSLASLLVNVALGNVRLFV